MFFFFFSSPEPARRCQEAAAGPAAAAQQPQAGAPKEPGEPQPKTGPGAAGEGQRGHQPAG